MSKGKKYITISEKDFSLLIFAATKPSKRDIWDKIIIMIQLMAALTTLISMVLATINFLKYFEILP